MFCRILFCIAVHLNARAGNRSGMKKTQYGKAFIAAYRARQGFLDIFQPNKYSSILIILVLHCRILRNAEH